SGLLMSGVIATGLEPAVGAFVELGRTGRGFAPSLAASLVYVPRESGASSADSSAQFGYVGGRISLCPVNAGFGDRFALPPCIAADFGQLSAVTAFPDPLPEQMKFWGAALLLGRFRFRLLGPFFGETIAGIGVPFHPNDRFVLERSGNQEV